MHVSSNSTRAHVLGRSETAINPSLNGTASVSLDAIVGWVSSSNDRGTADILWTSCITIFLCVCVATYPNVPSPKDKWYHHFIDKANLACIGFLGPDFLFGIAIGQLSNARRSVRMFRGSSVLPKEQKWTLTHAFFADMGGFHLKAPDYPEGFPINAEQLLYLVKEKHVDFPILTKEDINHRSRVDDLSRIITIWQALWFIITEVYRVANGYPMTTLELTAISFAVVMLATSASWYYKPSISQAIYLETKDRCEVRKIRLLAGFKDDPNLPLVYHRTPLDFISHRAFHFDKHWQYYSEVTHRMRLPVFNRRIKTTPWDRFPSDIWFPIEDWVIPFGSAVQIPFCFVFLLAWNFHFPTATERLLWRVCAVYHAVFSFIGGAWYMFGPFNSDAKHIISLHALMMKFRGRRRGDTTRKDESSSPSTVCETSPPLPIVRRKTGLPRSAARFEGWLVGWRNISPDQDPEMEVPLRWSLPFFVLSVVYILCRLYIYLEDFIGLREQPSGIYVQVNKFTPFF